MHIDYSFFPVFCFGFFLEEGTTHSYSGFTHALTQFLKRAQVNKQVQVRQNDLASLPVFWFSEAQLGSGSHGTGEYPSMHWGAGVNFVD